MRLGNGRDCPKERRKVLSEALASSGIGSALVSNPKHVFYLTGYPSNLNPWLTLMSGPRSTSFLVVESSGKSFLLIGAAELRRLTAATRKDHGHKERVKDMPDVEITTYADCKLEERMITYGDVLCEELRRWL